MKQLPMRLRLRTLMIAVAVLTPLVYLVVLPLYRYYSLSPWDRAIVDALEGPIDLPFANGATLESVLKYIKARAVYTKPPGPYGTRIGVPIYVDPFALDGAQVTMQAPVRISSKGAKLRTSLAQVLKPLGLDYRVKDGILVITSEKAIKLQQAAEAKHAGQ